MPGRNGGLSSMPSRLRIRFRVEMGGELGTLESSKHHKKILHERFNQSAVTFIKDALERLIRTQLDVEPYLLDLEGINRILIKDSVCFQIHESLSTDYPGSGGAGSPASMRIQFEYDLLCRKINDLSLNAFNDQDATNAVSTSDLLSAGDLIVRDLAYVGLTALKGSIKKAAYFLCRASPGVNVYELIGDQYNEMANRTHF